MQLKKGTNNSKHNKHATKTPALYKTPKFQTTTTHDIHQMYYSLNIPLPLLYGHRNLRGTFVPKNFNVTHFTSK